jgi:hypothetical protein
MAKYKAPRPDGGSGRSTALKLIGVGVAILAGTTFVGEGRVVIPGVVVALALFVTALVVW